MSTREVNEEDLLGLLELYTQLHDNTLPEMGKSLFELWGEILQDKIIILL